MAVDRDDLLAWVRRLQRVYADNRAWLTDLDAAIGDADHGINMNRGFDAVAAELQNTVPESAAGLLKAVAMILIRTVGGASGPLYGTFFLRAAAACEGRQHLTPADAAALFAAGLEGVVQRGRAEPDDKTMVDALTPAVTAMKDAAARGGDLAEVFSRGAAAAEAGMRRTVDLVARKGRASYLGERSVGHQDPGATSAFLMIRAAADSLSDGVME